MGNAESSSSGVTHKEGYHVLQVQPGSPASGLIFPFWDVIIGAQQQIFDKEGKLIELFKAHENNPLSLLVYSLRTERTREVVIIPRSNWGGVGLVGISIRFCAFDHTLELVWHVLDVYVDSPAFVANLSSRTDYIIGTPEHIFTDSEDFFNLINVHMMRPVQLYVYNALTEEVRTVTITPNKEWGGSGSLGCDIGYGYLHRIPLRLPLTPSPQNTKFPLPSSPQNNPSILATNISPDHIVKLSQTTTSPSYSPSDPNLSQHLPSSPQTNQNSNIIIDSTTNHPITNNDVISSINSTNNDNLSNTFSQVDLNEKGDANAQPIV